MRFGIAWNQTNKNDIFQDPFYAWMSSWKQDGGLPLSPNTTSGRSRLRITAKQLVRQDIYILAHHQCFRGACNLARNSLNVTRKRLLLLAIALAFLTSGTHMQPTFAIRRFRFRDRKENTWTAPRSQLNRTQIPQRRTTSLEIRETWTKYDRTES